MRLDLIPLDEENLHRLEANAIEKMELGNEDSREFHQMIATVLAETRAFMERQGTQAPWLSYLAYDPQRGGLVGNCSFKGSPTAEGEVEIGFVTFPQFEGHGYATEMARQLIELVREQGGVRRIVAVSQAEHPAASRVLEKHGFVPVDRYEDEEHGPLQEWALALE